MRHDIYKHQINTATEAINALGGDAAVADLFGFEDVRRVWNWHDRGLPPETHDGMGPMLTALGLHFSPALFKQYPVDRVRYRKRVNGNG